MFITGLNLTGWTQFQTNLQTAFKLYDAPGDALEKINALQMGNTSIEELAHRKIQNLDNQGWNLEEFSSSHQLLPKISQCSIAETTPKSSHSPDYFG